MKLPRSYFNYISYVGTLIAAIAWFALVVLVVIVKVFNVENIYFDLYTLIVVPCFLLLGLTLIAVGMYFERRKQKKGVFLTNEKLFILDLKDTRTRNAIIIFSGVTIIFVFSTVLGSYKGFHYTESIEFCGKLCHKVMNPEYVAYQYSSHAKVKCGECHIGEGVEYYMKSKISGLRQVFKYASSTYPTPIETPLHNLRPAKETCEKCHWPQRFYQSTLRKEEYILSDSANTGWDLIMKMRLGAEFPALGNSGGIHAHINPDIEIEYASAHDREYIPWIKVTNKKTGKEQVFTDQDGEKMPKDSELKEMPIKKMDCMDCHNRPAHQFFSPSVYVNELFVSRKISSSVPWLKKAAMEALNDDYSTTDSAKMGIENQIYSFYREQYPEVLAAHEEEIKNAVIEIKESFSHNAFPEMKVSYKAYPRNIGHLESGGCFRCHDDKHKSSDGKVISKDCNLCHTFIGQGKSGEMVYSTIDSTMEFLHPEDIGDSWKETHCSECHFSLY